MSYLIFVKSNGLVTALIDEMDSLDAADALAEKNGDNDSMVVTRKFLSAAKISSPEYLTVLRALDPATTATRFADKATAIRRVLETWDKIRGVKFKPGNGKSDHGDTIVDVPKKTHKPKAKAGMVKILKKPEAKIWHGKSLRKKMWDFILANCPCSHEMVLAAPIGTRSQNAGLLQKLIRSGLVEVTS